VWGFPQSEIAQILLSDSSQLIDLFKQWTLDDYFQKSKIDGPAIFIYHYLNEDMVRSRSSR